MFCYGIDLCIVERANAYFVCRSAVIGLYVSYATPIFLRITSGRDKLVPGPFSLGKWYMPIGIIAVAWVTFIVILLLFPPGQTTTAQDMSTSSFLSAPVSNTLLKYANTLMLFVDYAVVIIMGVFIGAGIYWLVSARKWFKGPVKTVELDSQEVSYDEKQHQMDQTRSKE